MIRHLFVPGLLQPVAGFDQAQLGRLPHLETLLARADRTAEPLGYPAALFALFGIATPADADLPTAAVSYLADTGEAPPGFLLHADPLRLVPDRDRVLAFGLDDDPLDGEELAQLEAAFNSHFGEEGIRLEAGPSGGVYLHCDRYGSVRTQALATVVGRDLDAYLPDGDDRRWWHGLLNETQMLCHALPFNLEREAMARPALNGLWFSGAGLLPAAGSNQVKSVQGDCLLARGLVSLCAGTGEDELVVEQAAGEAVMHADPGAWQASVVALDQRLVELQQDCASLHVHPGNGTVYRWQPGMARRWWRRRRPLAAFLDANMAS